MKLPAKLLLFTIALALFVFGGRHLMSTGAIPRPSMFKTLVPLNADAINANVLGDTTNVKLVDLPSNTPSKQCLDGNTSNCISSAIHEIEAWAWNAQLAALFSVGGAPTSDGKGIQTSKGSLMEKYGVMVKVTRQDDTGQMKTDMVDTAKRLVNDPNASGTKYVVIMGDGAAQFFADTKKLCPTCEFQIVTIFGYSRGEDGLWGLADWIKDPQKMKGVLIIGVIRDGDWNIAMKFLAQNGVPNNPDDKVYDPNAVNWINADSYTKAAEMLAQGTCLPVGFPIKGSFGDKLKEPVCATGAVTWTPGDVTIAKQRGGFVPIMTTKQSVFQMPAVLIGIKPWMAAHRADVENIIAATTDAADQVRANPAALRRGAEISNTLYKEPQTGTDYWLKYFKGVNEPDKTGVTVSLGGSAVSNLSDVEQSFGLKGGANLLAATYNTFGKIVVQQYPKMYPDFPPASQVIDDSYVKAVMARSTATTSAESFAPIAQDAHITKVAGKRDYNIQFASGSATILPSSYADLNQLVDELVITKYIVALHGYTDSQKWAGLTPEASADKNQKLSEDRANAVEAYLKSRKVTNVINAQGHGQEEPKATFAASRRVKVVLGSN